MSRQRGFVLVNALVLVAALAAAVVFLLARAEQARARRAEVQGAVQVQLYLDSFEALAITVLDADTAGAAPDHLGEVWARAGYNVPLDRGRVSGGLTDLQGRFNVNWLSDPGDIEARAAFDRLALRIGLSPESAAAIAAFVSPDGPGAGRGYAAATPPLAPVGGPVLMLEQLRIVPGLKPAEFAALRAIATALPSDSQVNANTVAPEVLQAFLPAINAAALDQVLQARLRKPFVSVDDFLLRLGAAAGPAAIAGIDDTRFSISSRWFRADSAAEIGDRILHRRTVFERLPLPLGVRVAYRIDQNT